MFWVADGDLRDGIGCVVPIGTVPNVCVANIPFEPDVFGEFCGADSRCFEPDWRPMFFVNSLPCEEPGSGVDLSATLSAAILLSAALSAVLLSATVLSRKAVDQVVVLIRGCEGGGALFKS